MDTTYIVRNELRPSKLYIWTKFINNLPFPPEIRCKIMYYIGFDDDYFNHESLVYQLYGKKVYFEYTRNRVENKLKNRRYHISLKFYIYCDQDPINLSKKYLGYVYGYNNAMNISKEIVNQWKKLHNKCINSTYPFECNAQVYLSRLPPNYRITSDCHRWDNSYFIQNDQDLNEKMNNKATGTIEILYEPKPRPSRIINQYSVTNKEVNIILEPYIDEKKIFL